MLLNLLPEANGQAFARTRATPMGAALLTAIVIVAALILLNAFFSLAETSLTATSRARMTTLEKDGDRLARRVIKLTDDRERMIGAVLLGSNLVTIAASAIATTVLGDLYGQDLGPIIATVALTPLLLIFGEVLPKTWAITNADQIARLVALPIQWMVIILAPIVSAVQAIVQRALRLFGVKVEEGVDVYAARDEIRGAIDLHHQEGAVEREDRDMIRGALDLGELTVGDVMVHRKNMRMIEVDLPPREILAQVLATPHSRLPLWRDEPDNIVGVLHAKDLLSAIAVAGGNIDSVDVTTVARQPWFVPETTELKEQLSAFLKARSHFALVVDEYGALMGLITLEDILEEIVGDIKDEYDVAVQGVRPQPDGSVNVDGWVPIRDLNRAMDWNLPDDEAVTVAGLVIHEAAAIPDPGQRYAFYGHRFTILRKNRNQITALRIEPPQPADDDAA